MITHKTKTLSPLRLKRIDEFTSPLINTGQLAGTITLVAHRGKIVHQACQGMQNIVQKKPMQTDTLFRIYSMTKPLTCIAAMMLYERGAFDLTTPISAIIPELKNLSVYAGGSAKNYWTVPAAREIIISDLLTHTAGFTYDFLFSTVVDELYREHGIKGLDSDFNSDEFIRRLSQLPLLFTPGSRFNYSVSIDVLGVIIERISKRSLAEFFQKEIFEPLEMVDTSFHVPVEKSDRLAMNYLLDNQTLVPIDDIETRLQPPSFYSGGSGLISTVTDYLKFSSFLLNKGKMGNQHLIGLKTFEMMTQNHLPSDIDNYSFIQAGRTAACGYGMGFGFAVNINPVAAKCLGNQGEFAWSGAANTYFFVDPTEELIGIFLTQLFPFDLNNIMFRRFKTAIYQAIISE